MLRSPSRRDAATCFTERYCVYPVAEMPGRFGWNTAWPPGHGFNVEIICSRRFLVVCKWPDRWPSTTSFDCRPSPSGWASVPSMLSLPVAELAESFESSGKAVESLCDFRYGELVNSNWTDHWNSSLNQCELERQQQALDSTWPRMKSCLPIVSGNA